MEGVVGLIDASSIPSTGKNVCGLRNDQIVFATDKVIWAGQPICGVVARDHMTAKRAAATVKVAYGDSGEKPIIGFEEAIASGKRFHDPILFSNHRSDKDKSAYEDLEWEGVEHVLKGEMKIGGQKHWYMEPNSCVVFPRENREMEVFSSTQDANFVVRQVSSVLGIPIHKISVRVKRVGGGFGGKALCAPLVAVPTAIAALHFNKPVRCILDRTEDMQLVVGFKKDGTLLRYKTDIYDNCGYADDINHEITTRSCAHIGNAYYIPQLMTHGHTLKTNLQSSLPMRALGNPQAHLFTENVIDRVADELDVSPESIRELNMQVDGKVTFGWESRNTTNVQLCWDACKNIANFDARRKEVDAFNKGHKTVKRGLSMVPTRFGVARGPGGEFMEQAGALVNIYTDGSVLVHHSGIEMGQGLNTKLCQIAADTLGVSLSKVHIQGTATDTVPNATGTHASRGTDMNSLAVKAACETLLERLVPIKKANPDAPWEFLIFKAYFARTNLSAVGFYKANMLGYDFGTGEGMPYEYFVFGAACAEVEVDCLTGAHKFVRADVVMDLGNSINPALDVGQIEGAFVQGYGMCTVENLQYDEEGNIETRYIPELYRIPTAGEIPRQFNVQLVTPPDADKIAYTAKAVGEPPVFLGTSAFFAIKDAIRSTRKDKGLPRYFPFNSPATAKNICFACAS